MKLALLYSLDYSHCYPVQTLPSPNRLSDGVKRFAEANDFNKIKQFKNQQATRVRFSADLEKATKQLVKGDSLLIFFSGHGTQIPITDNSISIEHDMKDEAICFFDGNYLDNELFDALCELQKGISVLIIIDSCHSGGMLRNGDEERKQRYLKQKDEFARNKAKLAEEYTKMQASVAYILSSSENEYSRSGSKLSWFGKQLLKELEKSSQTTYANLFERLHGRKFENQTIQCIQLGKRKKIWRALNYKNVTFKSK